MPATMSLTDRQRQIVTETFARLVPISSESAAIFYQRLWDIAPETKLLFQTTDMTLQGMKLMQTLGMTVRALHDPESIRPLLHDLGQRHVGYGVKVEQFEFVKVALLWMIEQCIGPHEFTAETRDAWIAAYDLIAGLTLSAFD